MQRAAGGVVTMAGGGSPLDLAALEARWRMVASLTMVEDALQQAINAAADVRDLLAVLRETRAALSDAICMSPQAKWIAVLAKAVEGG